MNDLKLSYIDIRNSINLKTNWINNNTTNCYAFALGLDINENDIIDTKKALAYDLGEIGKYKYNLSTEDIRLLSFESRLFIDLDSLGIEYERVNQFEKSYSSIDNDGYISWVIALYDASGKDFHFLRKLPNNKWMHKRSRMGNVILYDDKINEIEDLNNFYIYPYRNIEYEQVGVYKLILK